jgi:hypothetical protein
VPLTIQAKDEIRDLHSDFPTNVHKIGIVAVVDYLKSPLLQEWRLRGLRSGYVNFGDE